MAMQIAEVTEDVALILPIVILVEGIVGLVAWFALGARGGRAARFAAWLGLVTLTLWCGSAVAFVLLHILLFAFGSAAAMLGAIVTTVLMILMPFGWAAVIRHHESSDHEHLPR
jgi:Na+-driven multidrug efflux pump